MPKLTPQLKDLILLINRSPQDEQGWANVSSLLWPMISKKASENPDIFELLTTSDAGLPGRIRLTDTGKTILEYI